MRFSAVAIGTIFFGLAGLLPGQDVSTQYDRGFNFAAYKTYKWISIPSSSTANPITAQNIMNCADSVLATKGFVKVEDDPDMLLGFQTGVQQQQQLNYWNEGGPWMGGFGSATTSTINVGSLVLDVYDPKVKQLVWRAHATKTLSPNANATKNYKTLEKAVSKMLKKFPPEPGK